jgi:hypothetical protein
MLLMSLVGRAMLSAGGYPGSLVDGLQLPPTRYRPEAFHVPARRPQSPRTAAVRRVPAAPGRHCSRVWSARRVLSTSMAPWGRDVARADSVSPSFE